MKKAIVILSLILFCKFLISQDQKYLYSGGMLFFQPGYTIAQNPHQQINNLGFGIGGVLRFYIKDHLCVGIIGGSQKTGYDSPGSENSYISLGYGGPLVGYTYFKNKLRFCASISAGKGRIKNLHIQSQTGVVLNDADYYSHSAWVGYPMLSLDYMMTKKIAFTSQVICISALYNENDLYFCPVFQIGILFNR